MNNLKEEKKEKEEKEEKKEKEEKEERKRQNTIYHPYVINSLMLRDYIKKNW